MYILMKCLILYNPTQNVLYLKMYILKTKHFQYEVNLDICSYNKYIL